MFLDQVTIRVEGGEGGSGVLSFRREALVPRGGPDGGDGGRGGSVILEADPQLSTLIDFRYLAEYRGERGQHGSGSNKTGKSGEDRLLRVPPGTQVRDADTGELLGELIEPGQRIVVAKGGRGGRGNAQFTSATNQAPTRFEPGGEGDQRTLELTLKLIADVGLVGEPNAGKSTFLASISDARPKVAAYPFTTLQPNLGVVRLTDFRSFVVADIPGIIEGAAEGRGLGHQFLRHIERTRSLALLVPVNDPDPQATYDQLRNELAQYSPALARRPFCVLLTKTDLLGPDDPTPVVRASEAWGVFALSSVARSGLEPVLEALWNRVRRGAALEGSEGEAWEVGDADEVEEAAPRPSLEGGDPEARGADGTLLDDEASWWGGEPL
jgi:GTPase